MKKPILPVPVFYLASIVLLACGAGGGATLAPDAGGPDPDASTAEPDASIPDPDAGPEPEPGIPLEREHAGGLPAVAVLAERLAFVGVGPRLAVWDLSESASPALLGESSVLPGLVSDIVVHGSYALVTTWTPFDGHLHVFDVSDPRDPVAMRAVRLGDGPSTRPLSLARTGDRLFVADSRQGIIELDIREPPAPDVVRLVPNVAASTVQVAGNRLYAFGTNLAGRWVNVYDLDDDLVMLGSSVLAGARDATVADGHRVVVATNDSIQVYDFADPNKKTLLFSAAINGAQKVTSAGTKAYVAGQDSLYAVDLSSPGTIFVVGPAARDLAQTTGMATSQDLLIRTTDRGDLSVEALPSSQGQPPLALVAISACARCTAVAVDDASVAFAQGGSFSTGAISASRLTDLAGLSHLRLDAPSSLRDIAFADGHALVADFEGALRVVKVSGALGVRPVKTQAIAGNPVTLAVVGSRVYVGVQSPTGNSVRVYTPNVGDLIERGSIEVGVVRDVAGVGSLLLVAEEGLPVGGGLAIYDASNPANITSVGYYDSGGSAYGVAVSGNTAVLATHNNGFHVVDITDPAAPVTAAVLEQPAGTVPGPVEIKGPLAFLGHSKGVRVVDVSSPVSPMDLAELATVARPTQIVSPLVGRVVVATGVGGVYQWEF